MQANVIWGRELKDHNQIQEYGIMEWRKLHDQELHILHHLLKIVRVI
jgi:hypothetical protein